MNFSAINILILVNIIAGMTTLMKIDTRGIDVKVETNPNLKCYVAPLLNESNTENFISMLITTIFNENSLKKAWDSLLENKYSREIVNEFFDKVINAKNFFDKIFLNEELKEYIFIPEMFKEANIEEILLTNQHFYEPPEIIENYSVYSGIFTKIFK